MSRPEQPDSLQTFIMLQEAFSAQTSDAAQARALLAAHVTSNLLLAEHIQALETMVGLLVAEMRESRLSRRRSSGSPGTVSPSGSGRSTRSDTSGPSGQGERHER